MSELTADKYDAARDKVEVEQLECPEEPGGAGIEELLDTGKAENESKGCEQQNPEFPRVRNWFKKARERESWLTRIFFSEGLALHVTAVGDEQQDYHYDNAGGSGFEKYHLSMVRMVFSYSGK